MLLCKKNLDEDINNYSKVIELNPYYTEAYFNKGNCLSNQQKKKKLSKIIIKLLK